MTPLPMAAPNPEFTEAVLDVVAAIPEELISCLGNPDPEKAQFAMQAMLKQKKIVISELTA